MYLKTAAALLAAVLIHQASVHAFTVSGKVTNQSGKAISNAIVTLMGKKMKDTTDAQGVFKISDGTFTVNPVTNTPRMEQISINQGIVKFSVANPSPVRIELFDMRGVMVKRVLSQHATTGEYHYNISRDLPAMKMLLINVAIGELQTTFRYMPFNNGGNMFATIGTSTGATDKLAKIQAVVDSLSIAASNYMSKTVPIATYQDSVTVKLDTMALAKFSFFVVSQKATQEWSKSTDGFGGDFRFGKTGQGAGLLGADSICQCIAEKSMKGSGVKQWRAFLSAAKGPDGTQVNAIDRIGKGPWFDRTGRKFSDSLPQLINTRPAGADEDIINDLPNEDGVPNHTPDPSKPTTTVDNHHMLTGSNASGKLNSATSTCDDWTSTTYTGGKPMCGFAWPRSTGGGFGKTTGGMGGSNWMTSFTSDGCKAGAETVNNGAGTKGTGIVGNGGGYGGFYCFALNP